ncbi:MAG: efflux RND transporter permease subunit, partial [Planctomycetota bacterium]
MFERIGILLKRRSKSVALVLGLLVIPAAFAIPKLRFDFTPQAIFEGDDDLVSTAEDVRDTFGYDDAVVLLILADDDAEAASVAEAASGVDLEPQVTLPTLLWQAEVLTAIEDAGAVESVASLTRAELPVIVKPRPIELGSRPLLPYDDIELDELPLVQSALTNSPLLRKRFLGANGRDLIAYLQLGPDRRKYEGMQTAVSAIRKVLADHPAPEGKRAFLSGLPPLRVQVVEDLHAEQKRLMPLTALILVIVLGLLFRSAVWAALPLIAVGLGLIYTVGTVAAAGGSFSLVTNILPLLLFILGVTNAAHIVTRYGEECRRTPNDRYAAALSTIQHLGLACLLTALTTACGFLSLLVARASVLQQLAWQAAVGLFLVYFATITVFGITLWRFRPPWMRESGDSKPRLPPIERALVATSNLVLARPWLVLIGSLLLIGLAVTSGLSVRPDGLMTEMYDPDHPEVQRLGYVERNLGGFVTLDIDLRAEPGRELTRADVMKRVLSLERQLAGEPLVLSSESFASLLEAVREGPLGSAAGDTAPALTDD